MFLKHLPSLQKALLSLTALCGFQGLREIIEAAHGLKVARLCIGESIVPRLVPLLESLDLRVDLRNRKQILAPDSGKGGWISGYGLEVELEHPAEGYLHLYAGKDAGAVLAAKKAEHSAAIAEFGQHLGYPKCCVSFYEAKLEEAEARQGDFMLPLFAKSLGECPDNSPVFPWWTNMAAQYFNAGLLSFYPCSLFCPHAIMRARLAYTMLWLYDPALAERAAQIALSPVIYTEYEGVYRLLNSVWGGGVVFYDGVEASLDGALGALLAKGNVLRIRSPHAIGIYGNRKLIGELDHPTLLVMLFEKMGDE